jgi:hypothetical protein
MVGRRESCLTIVGTTGMTMASVSVKTEWYREHSVAELGVVRVKYWLQCLIPSTTIPIKGI